MANDLGAHNEFRMLVPWHIYDSYILGKPDKGVKTEANGDYDTFE